MKTTIIIVMVAVVAFISFYLYILSHGGRSDVSDDPKFKDFLNKSFPLQDSATLIWYADKYQYRFQPYALQFGYSSNYDEPTHKTIKNFNPGDKVTFHQALKYKSLHVGSTYYLIGKEILPSGEVIEFEYAYSNLNQLLWETKDEFLDRRKRERKRQSEY